MIADLRPYPVMKDSGVPWLGEVPAHWDVCRLKSRLLRNDSGVWSDEFDADGTVVLRSTEQTLDGRWRISAPARIRLSPSQRDAALLLEGDLVVTKSSGSSDHIGKTSVVSRDVAAMNCCFSNFMQRLRLSPAALPSLVWRYLNSPIGREQLVVHSNTTTGLGNLNAKTLGDCVLAFPSLPEQTAIVHFLDRTDRRIRRYILAKQKLVELLGEQKRAVIQTAISQGLDHNVRMKRSGVRWLGDVPGHWGVRPAKYFYREVDERSVTGQEELLSVSHITGVTPRSRKSVTMFMASSYVGHKLCRAEDLVVNTMWAWMGALGVAHQAGIVSRSYAVYRPLVASELLAEFADLLLRIPAYVSEYARGSTGVTSSRLRLYPEQFLRIPIVCPPGSEQQTIIRRVTIDTAAIEHAISRAHRELSLLREYRVRLVTDVVTGKFDVREAATMLPHEADDPESFDEINVLSDSDATGADAADAIPEDADG